MRINSNNYLLIFFFLRIGFSGSPGAGKSTLIETLGKSLTGSDHRVAVLVSFNIEDRFIICTLMLFKSQLIV